MPPGGATKIEGHVEPGFASVRDAFEQNFAEAGEVGASFAVYRNGRALVDLWAGHRDRARTRPWTEDTLVNVWSSTKGMAALVCALLVERGALDYDAPVASLWPEFGLHGKRDVTVGMLLSHQAGLSATREPVTELDFCDPEKINALLLAQEPLFEPGTTSGYHALTFGPLVGEVVRLASGRSLGRFFREEIAEPLGLDFHIGLPESEEARVAEMIAPAEKPEVSSFASNPVQRLALGNPATDPEVPNQRAWRAAEIPSANGQSDARSLARAYDLLASGGALSGVALLSADTLERAVAVRIAGPDRVLGLDMEWAAGFLRNRDAVIYGPHPAAYGHSGFGGSFGFADPRAGLGVGYAMNQMGANLAGDPRTLRLVGSLYAALTFGGPG